MAEPVLVANVGDKGVVAVVQRLRLAVARATRVRQHRRAGRDRPAGRPRAPVHATVRRERRSLVARGAAELLTGPCDPDGTRMDHAGDRRVCLLAPLTTRLGLAGRHNAANALGVARAALALGVAPDAIAAGLASFEGVGRRLERKGGGGASSCTTIMANHRPRSVRLSRPSARESLGEAHLGRVRAAHVPPDGRHARPVRGGARRCRCSRIADIWASRDPDTTVTSAARWRRRLPGATRRSRRRPRGRSRQR